MPLDFSLTQEQEAIKQLAHEFAEKEIRPVAAHHDETEEFPYEVVKKAHRLGLTADGAVRINAFPQSSPQPANR